LEKVLGLEIRRQKEKGRTRLSKSEVDRLLADNTLDRKILKWEPKAAMDEGLQRAILHEYRTNEYGT
jgi:nucleoside-diphosphate-sugar epimerase